MAAPARLTEAFDFVVDADPFDELFRYAKRFRIDHQRRADDDARRDRNTAFYFHLSITAAEGAFVNQASPGRL